MEASEQGEEPELFVMESLQPMLFSIRVCPSKAALQRIIEVRAEKLSRGRGYNTASSQCRFFRDLAGSDIKREGQGPFHPLQGRNGRLERLGLEFWAHRIAWFWGIASGGCVALGNKCCHCSHDVLLMKYLVRIYASSRLRFARHNTQLVVVWMAGTIFSIC